jgi:hypothetical protein
MHQSLLYKTVQKKHRNFHLQFSSFAQRNRPFAPLCAVVRINPGTLVEYIAIERIKGGPYIPERNNHAILWRAGFTFCSTTTGGERRRFLHRVHLDPSSAPIKATGPTHSAPTRTLAGDCSGRTRSCPPATQHRKPSNPSVNNIS